MENTYKCVELYGPNISHHRRAHAPDRRYISSDITLNEMHENFCCVTGLQVSDSFYYKAFKEIKISHAKLGNETCEQCHLFEQHKKDCKCEILCEFYTRQAKHQRRYRVARPSYESDSNSQQSPTSPIFEADMQKVLLLPQMDQLKKKHIHTSSIDF